MGGNSPNTSQLETFALAAILATSFAAIPLLVWSAGGGVLFFP